MRQSPVHCVNNVNSKIITLIGSTYDSMISPVRLVPIQSTKNGHRSGLLTLREWVCFGTHKGGFLQRRYPVDAEFLSILAPTQECQ